MYSSTYSSTRGSLFSKKRLRPDLALGYGSVGYGELHGGLRAEVVVELAHRREHRLLVLLARGLVADVPELDGLAEEALLDLRGPVGVHGVVADRGKDVFGLGSRAPLAARRLLDFLLLFLEPRRAACAAAHGSLPLRAAASFSLGFLLVLSNSSIRLRPLPLRLALGLSRRASRHGRGLRTLEPRVWSG